MNKPSFNYIVLATFILSLFANVYAKKDEEQVLDIGFAGFVDTPLSWTLSGVENNSVIIRKDNGTGEVKFSKLESGIKDGMKQYLSAKAKELGIPAFPRRVDEELLERNHVDKGFFINGTVLDSSSDSTYTSTFADSSTFEHPASKYLMVVLYSWENEVLLMEAWTTDVPDGVLEMNRFQRTWRQFKKFR